MMCMCLRRLAAWGLSRAGITGGWEVSDVDSGIRI